MDLKFIWGGAALLQVCFFVKDATRSDIKSRSMNLLEISPEEFKRISERVLKIAVEYLQDIDARKIPPRKRFGC